MFHFQNVLSKIFVFFRYFYLNYSNLHPIISIFTFQSLPSRRKIFIFSTNKPPSSISDPPCARTEFFSRITSVCSESQQTRWRLKYVVEQHELIINKNYGKALSTNRSKEPKRTGTTACGRGLPQAPRLSSLIP